MLDFTHYPLSGTQYGGSERKLGIIINGNEYMLKFQKTSPLDSRFNHISEYIGSHIFEILGFDVQETCLGTYEGKNVVACKNFISASEQFVPFNEVGESTLEQDKEIYQYSYEDIMQMLRDNVKLTHVEESINLFWRIYIVDALLGNFDRHGLNWGFIKSHNKYRLAPVFDNGACLFPQMCDEDIMKKIIASKEETEKRVLQFPTSQIKLNGQKSSYYEVISSLRYPECNEALEYVMNKIDMTKIEKLVTHTEGISETHKEFYLHMLRSRYKLILEESYSKLKANG